MSTTYIIGEEELNVTYNYAWIFYRLNKDGLKTISGMTGKQALKALEEFESKLCSGGFGCANKDKKKEEDYWVCSPNNCYHNAIKPLMEMSKRNLNKKFTAF